MVHIVDTLIEERAEKLRQHPRLWSFIQQFMYPLFGYQDAVSLINHIQTMSGFDVFQHLSRTLKMQVHVDGLEHLP